MITVFKRAGWLVVSLVSVFMISGPRQTAWAADKVSLEELNKMEMEADEARQLYWRGNIDGAVNAFTRLTTSVHPSVALYKNELAVCYLTSGKYPEAMACLRDVTMLLDSYTDKKRESAALSKFGKEEEKIYRGDPYEQASAYMLLALLFMDNGDFDNALAACKSGILCDSDASENMYESDFTLLHVLESRCLLAKKDKESFENRRKTVAESYRTTSPQVRTIFSERLDNIELLRMTPSERKKVGVTYDDEALKSKIASLDDSLKDAFKDINAEVALKPFYNGDYNTLVVIPVGRVPYKARKGKDAQLIFFECVDTQTPGQDIKVDGKPLDQKLIVPNIADMEFQATTRGGRHMDAILNGKAAFRSTTVGVGSVITEIGNNVGGVAGLGVALIGAVVQGVGGSVTPEADTRCWQLLPEQFTVIPLNMDVGEHTITSSHYVYFERVKPVTRSFNIQNADDFAVIVLPPCESGLFSETVHSEMKLSKRDTSKSAVPGAIAITPPLGLRRIERFMAGNDIKSAEAVAPDPVKVMRNANKILASKGMDGYLVAHGEVVSNRVQLAKATSRALQVTVDSIAKEKVKRTVTYKVSATMNVIDTAKGTSLCSKSLTGEAKDVETGPSDAFYFSLDDAMTQFISSPEFAAAIKGGAEKAVPAAKEPEETKEKDKDT